MKARIKKTGEIVKLADYAVITLDSHDSYGNPIEMKPEEVELIQEPYEDEHKNASITTQSTEQIDAVFDMVVKLKEKNLL